MQQRCWLFAAHLSNASTDFPARRCPRRQGPEPAATVMVEQTPSVLKQNISRSISSLRMMNRFAEIWIPIQLFCGSATGSSIPPVPDALTQGDKLANGVARTARPSSIAAKNGPWRCLRTFTVLLVGKHNAFSMALTSRQVLRQGAAYGLSAEAEEKSDYLAFCSTVANQRRVTQIQLLCSSIGDDDKAAIKTASLMGKCQLLTIPVDRLAMLGFGRGA